MQTILESRSERVIIGLDRPLCVIGERINPTGRKQLAALMAAGDFSLVERDAVDQVRAGARVLDVNAGVPLADEPALLRETVRRVQELVDVPLCLDSSVVAALEAALEVCEGKPLVNSVTAEAARLEQVLPLVAKHGAAVIGLVSGDGGIAATPEARLAEARKILSAAADHGIPAEDVVLDPLAMGVATDSRAPGVTLETIRLFRTELGANSVVGASNVSFGLPARSAITAAFIAMAMTAGLTAAIMNPLSADVTNAARAADLLLGNDEYGSAWISAFRSGEALVGGP
jgi:5-methyltetrahydrofolate--homocysteine methyltransferase